MRIWRVVQVVRKDCVGPSPKPATRRTSSPGSMTSLTTIFTWTVTSGEPRTKSLTGPATRKSSDCRPLEGYPDHPSNRPASPSAYQRQFSAHWVCIEQLINAHAIEGISRTFQPVASKRDTLVQRSLFITSRLRLGHEMG